MAQSTYFFISYARRDERFVLHLAARLKEHGVPIWLDQWDIPSGADWDHYIEEAIKHCQGMIVVLSPAGWPLTM